MMKRLLIFLLILTSFCATAQRYTADEFIGRKGFWLKDRWIRGIKNDTTGLINNDTTLPTSKAVYDFLTGRFRNPIYINGLSNGNGDTVMMDGDMKYNSRILIPHRFNTGGNSTNTYLHISNNVSSFPAKYSSGNTPGYPTASLYLSNSYFETTFNGTNYYDTLTGQYGGVLGTFSHRVLDQHSTHFDSVKSIALNYTGLYANGRFTPPQHKTTVYTHLYGLTPSPVVSAFDIGEFTYGYNIQIASTIAQYPMNVGFQGHFDANRASQRISPMTIGGNGVGMYGSDYRFWQGALITTSTTDFGSRIGKLYQHYAFGNTSTDLHASGVDKAKILAVSMIDSSFAFHAFPQWRAYNEVNNGYAFTQEGDSDYNWFAGALRIGGAMPTRATGGMPYKFEVIGGQIKFADGTQGNGKVWTSDINGIGSWQTPTVSGGSVTGTIAIANGGTGATTSTAALNALLPSQTGNVNKILTTDGTNASWQANAAPTITSGTAAPTSTPGKIGDIYVDTTARKLYFAVGNSSSSDWELVN